MVLKSVADAAGSVVAWPDSNRVAVQKKNAVEIYEVTSTGVSLAESLGAEDLGMSDAESIVEFAGFGDGLVMLVRSEEGQRLVHWTADAAEEMLALPDNDSFWWLVTSFSSKRVAVGSSRSVLVAAENDGEWAWGEPIVYEGERYIRVLALPDDGVLIGVNEINFPEDPPTGNGGASGAGGEGGVADTAARVERWNLDGARVESRVAVGNPATALELDADSHSYLIGETNSFWGSYQAALERYESDEPLARLANVPVISAADGEDGALDLAIVGERLYVANCESGLLTTDAPSTSDTELPALTPFEGPWTPENPGDCSTTRVEALGDVLVVGTATSVVFARLCAMQ